MSKGRDREYYADAKGMHVFDVIAAYNLNFWEGNVLKYLVRWRHKGGTDDLRKAISYLEELIARTEAEEEAKRFPDYNEEK